MAKHPKPRDLNQRAKAIVDAATSEDDDQTIGPPPEAVEQGRKGGQARAANMTPEQRSEAARRAARARWDRPERS